MKIKCHWEVRNRKWVQRAGSMGDEIVKTDHTIKSSHLNSQMIRVYYQSITEYEFVNSWYHGGKVIRTIAMKVFKEKITGKEKRLKLSCQVRTNNNIFRLYLTWYIRERVCIHTHTSVEMVIKKKNTHANVFLYNYLKMLSLSIVAMECFVKRVF